MGNSRAATSARPPYPGLSKTSVQAGGSNITTQPLCTDDRITFVLHICYGNQKEIMLSDDPLSNFAFVFMASFAADVVGKYDRRVLSGKPLRGG